MRKFIVWLILAVLILTATIIVCARSIWSKLDSMPAAFQGVVQSLKEDVAVNATEIEALKLKAAHTQGRLDALESLQKVPPKRLEAMRAQIEQAKKEIEERQQ